MLGKGDLGAAAGVVPMRTTCISGGTPSVCDARVIGGVIHHAAVIRITRGRLRRSQEDTFNSRMAAP